MAPTNFYMPYDINLRMTEWKNTQFRFGVDFEHGETRKSKNPDEDETGVLRLYNSTESSITMLMGADSGTDIYNLAAQLEAAGVTDDGTRGHFRLDGKFEETNLNFYGKYKFTFGFIPGNFDFTFYLPFKFMEIKDVSWNDLTESLTFADLLVHSLVTDSIANNVRNLGDLDIGAWKKSGLSDLAFLFNWYMDFKQTKEHLKNVRVSAKTGLTIPTGAKKNENKAFSFPLGNDGAWGIPFGVNLDLFFINDIKSGLEFELFFLFDETRVRRLKTDRNQTDFLLLHKGKATISHGFCWKFNLFFQLDHFWKGLSAMAAYRFFKHDEDTITAQSNNFNYEIINSAESLKEWVSQCFVFQLNYDFFDEFTDSIIKPQISFFYKLPVTGKRVINAHTFGAQFALNF